MFEPLSSAEAIEPPPADELPTPTDDPYGDVALGVECAWPVAQEAA